MKRKNYIKPFVEFSLIEVDSEILAGSPTNDGDNVLPGEGNEMGESGGLAPTIKDPTDPDSPPPVDAKGGIFIWDDEF